jgi:hypothetical protein
MWDPQHLTTQQTSRVCYVDSFTFCMQMVIVPHGKHNCRPPRSVTNITLSFYISLCGLFPSTINVELLILYKEVQRPFIWGILKAGDRNRGHADFRASSGTGTQDPCVWPVKPVHSLERMATIISFLNINFVKCPVLP